MRIDQYSRLLHHRLSSSGLTFTIPTSDDHTDETWLTTDLYIGELGINITDDRIYMRTNNGIVQIATGTSSTGSTSSLTNVWSYTSPNITISSTYSADSVSPRSGYYTDLGTTALRWKDLYLGGSSNGYTTINVNAGVLIKEQGTNAILMTNGISSNNSPIEIYGTSSNNTKDRPLHLNSTNCVISGTSERNITIGSNNILMTNGQNNIAIGASSMTFASGITSSIMIGRGYNKTNDISNSVVVGGTFQIRAVTDPGQFAWSDSDWKTTQANLSTTNATTTNIAQIPWKVPAIGGEIIQVKAYIIGCDESTGGNAFASEVMGTFILDGNLIGSQVDNPIYMNQTLLSNMDCQMTCDSSAVYIKVSGVAATTVNWLCTYSYHRMINLIQ